MCAGARVVVGTNFHVLISEEENRELREGGEEKEKKKKIETGGDGEEKKKKWECSGLPAATADQMEQQGQCLLIWEAI